MTALFIDGPWSGERRDTPPTAPPTRIPVTYLASGGMPLSGVYFLLTPVEEPALGFADRASVYRWSGPPQVPGLDQLPTLADEVEIRRPEALKARMLIAGLGYNPVSGRSTLRFGLLVPATMLLAFRQYAGMDVYRDPAVSRPGLVVWESGQPDGPAAGDLAEDITGRMGGRLDE